MYHNVDGRPRRNLAMVMAVLVEVCTVGLFKPLPLLVFGNDSSPRLPLHNSTDKPDRIL